MSDCFFADVTIIIKITGIQCWTAKLRIFPKRSGGKVIVSSDKQGGRASAVRRADLGA